jgi:hypothetical protein
VSVSESDLYPQILAAHSTGDTRLFRTHVGLYWAGKVIERTANRLVILNPRAIKVGAPGMSDLIGWTTVDGVAVYLAIEAKGARTRIEPEQQNYIELVRRMGGRAGIARSVEDAGRIIQGEIL